MTEKHETQLFELLEAQDITGADAINIVKGINLINSEHDPVRMVDRFLQTSGRPKPIEPTMPDVATRKLLITLIFEELTELALAFGEEAQTKLALLTDAYVHNRVIAKESNLIEAFDAILDLQVVLHNATYSCGFINIFHDGMEEVHASNMSKFCTTQEEADQTVRKYEEAGIEANAYLNMSGLYVVVRKSDLKVLKGINFHAPNLEQFII